MSQNKSKTVKFNGVFGLNTIAVLDHFPASSYAKFVRSYEHPEALTVLMIWQIPSAKKQVFTARVPTVQTIP